LIVLKTFEIQLPMRKNNLKYVFFGTPDFAAQILEKLILNNYPPSLIVCNPDKPTGRKKIITPPPVKKIAIKYGLEYYQPERLSFAEFKSKLGDSNNFGIVAAYGKIIPETILNLFNMGIIGIHPSLLPQYRGPSPIQSAILNGDLKTGISLFVLDNKMDHGKILASESIPIKDSDNFLDLQNKLADLGANLIIKILPKFLDGEIILKKQDEEMATYTKKFTSQDAFIEPVEIEKAINGDKKSALAVLRKINAFCLEPGAWTILEKPLRIKSIDLPPQKRIKLIKARIVNEKLEILSFQIEGKRQINILNS